jgi:DUF1009 family protein
MEKIGIFAGVGDIVSLAIDGIKKAGKQPVIFSFYDLNFPQIKFYKILIGDFEGFFNIINKENISKMIFIGKIHPEEMFKKDIVPAGAQFLKSLSTLTPEDVMLKLVDIFEKNNIKILPLSRFLKHNIAEEKIYSIEKPEPKQWVDIDFAWKMAKFIAQKKIGQAVSIKNGMVVAVEGIEGTDEMIKRTGRYCQDFTVAKVMRTGQSTKFDLPTIGPKTIDVFLEYKGKVLVFEAGKTIIVDEEKIKDIASKHNIIILGYKGKKDKYVD